MSIDVEGEMLEFLIMFGDQVAEHMDEQKLTRADLEERLSVERLAVCEVIYGERNLTVDELCKYAASVGKVPRVVLIDPDKPWDWRAGAQ